MELSVRLQTVAGAVTPGHRIADVGTDHGYVPIYLVKNHICPEAVAMDINSGPLDRAKEHIKMEGLEDMIHIRQSDGLLGLSPREADTVVIAGMGGDLICRILKAAPDFLAAGKEFVLQPQSEWFKVRHFICEHNYLIEKEWFLKEDGRYYVVIRAVPAPVSEDTDQSGQGTCAGLSPEKHSPDFCPDDSDLDQEVFFRYGWYLIRERDPVLLEYLKQEHRKKKKILQEMDRQGRTGLDRYKELKKEIEDIDNITKIYYHVNIFTG